MYPDKWQVRVVIDGKERVLTEKDDAALNARLLHFKNIGIPLDMVAVVPLREVMTGAQWLHVYMGVTEN